MLRGAPDVMRSITGECRWDHRAQSTSIINKLLSSSLFLLREQKALKSAVGKAVEGQAWRKFTNPTAGGGGGRTALPKGQAEQERLGVRWDYDGEVTEGDEVYHKFQMQPNAGKSRLLSKDGEKVMVEPTL
uniref:Uncharacterized protein n=1 Tax=Coccidioides posadasii RMSCC 3488 TaxID=454284 RepID=A0A0J6FQ67_COCPO|nr:hypothetical protein CPAG_07431 [Coccidioides posadasii RMSCC 3488]